MSHGPALGRCWCHGLQIMSRKAKLSFPMFETPLPAWARENHQRTSASASNVNRALQPSLLTLAEAAAQLRVSPRTLRRMVKAGDVTTIRIGRQLRFDRDTLWREINDLDSGRE